MRLIPCKIRDLQVGDTFLYKGKFFRLVGLFYQEGSWHTAHADRFIENTWVIEVHNILVYGIWDCCKVEYPSL